MERPAAPSLPLRPLTGEIVYLDYRRRTGQDPWGFNELDEVGRQSFDVEAEDYRLRGEQPHIMSEYDDIDTRRDQLCSEAVALADALLEHKREDSPVTFEDFIVPDNETSYQLVSESNIGKRLLAKPDVQLAIASNGEYYPILDIRRKDLTFTGMAVRVWGWQETRGAFIQPKGVPYQFPEHYLRFPEAELRKTRQFDIRFGYEHATAGLVTENLTMYVSDSTCSISTNYFVSEYAETGYEGHGGTSLKKVRDADILEFMELIAHIVGDEPETFHEAQLRRINQLIEATRDKPYAAQITRLIEASWPAQVLYELTAREHSKLHGSTILSMLDNEDEQDRAAAYAILAERIDEFEYSRKNRDKLHESGLF